MKRFLSCLLILAMVAVLLPFAAFADGDAAAATTPEGTAIKNAAELAAMEPDGTYYLANNISLSGSWSYVEFKGTLDGNGKTIILEDGITLNAGLFHQLGRNNNEGKILTTTTVKNLSIVQRGTVTFVNQDGQNQRDFGFLAGRAYGNVTIDNVTVKGEFMNLSGNNAHIGGLVGNLRNGNFTVTNCIFDGSFPTEGNTANNAGGIIGSFSDNEVLDAAHATFTISNCMTFGSVYGRTTAGGIVGTAQDDKKPFYALSIKNCANYATVTNTGAEKAAGVIGLVSYWSDASKLEICNNINYGDIKTTNASTQTQAGILGNLKFRTDTFSITISGNLNYCAISGNKAGPIVSNYYPDSNNDNLKERGQELAAMVTADNNFTIAIAGLTTKAPIPTTTPVIDANTLTTLNTAYPDTYVMQGEKITLKWVVDRNYDSDAVIEEEPVDFITLSKLTLDVTVPSATGTKITNAAELAAVTGDGTYYLDSDIEISGEWTSPKNFTGILHGNGHKIVFKGATVVGGLFNDVEGAKFYNMTITTAGENTFQTYTSAQHLFGTLASNGWGTFVNITVDCSVSVEEDGSSRIGGLIGRIDQGMEAATGAKDTAISGCVNYGNMAGAAAGGIVGVIYNKKTEQGHVEISNCVNYGTITSNSTDQGCGGIAGRVAQNMPFVTVSDCVNYGKVNSLVSGQHTGGIVGLKYLVKNGTFFVIRNINYGNVINNCKSNGTELGKPGGILGGISTSGYGDNAYVYGNVNYGIITGNDCPNQIAADIWGNGKVNAGYNYYGVDQSVANVEAFVSTTPATLIEDGTLAVLNENCENAFVTNGGKIALSWAVTAGLVAGKTGPSTGTDSSTTPGGDGDTTPGGDVTTADDTVTTEETPTGTDTTEPTGSDEGGCSSSVSVSFLFLAVLAPAGVALFHKKKF